MFDTEPTFPSLRDAMTQTLRELFLAEMSSMIKGNDWYFGMNAHLGVDAESGVTHSPDTSTAKLHDSQVRDALLHGEETSSMRTKATSAPSARPLTRVWARFWAHAKGPARRQSASTRRSLICRPAVPSA
jgi:IS5 family transposase